MICMSTRTIEFIHEGDHRKGGVTGDQDTTDHGRGGLTQCRGPAVQERDLPRPGRPSQ
jgi:hypothetical protein